MKKLLLIICLLPLIASAQITPAQDTTLITGSAAFTPQNRYTKVTLDGVSYRIPQVYNSILGKYDTYVTTKYLRAFYAPLVSGGYLTLSRYKNTLDSLHTKRFDTVIVDNGAAGIKLMVDPIAGAGIWSYNVTPGNSNYALVTTGANTRINAGTVLNFGIGGSSSMSLSTALGLSVSYPMRIGGAISGSTSDQIAMLDPTTKQVKYVAGSTYQTALGFTPSPLVQYTVYADNYTDTFTGWNADGFNHGSAIFQAYSAYPGKAIKIVLSNKTYVPVCQLVSKKLTRDNVTIVGAGMAQRADNAKSMSANTGTIIQGSLYPWANNFTISDLSIDAGITVSQTYYSSTLAIDGFVMSKYPYTAGGNDTIKTNLVARNINILLPDPNSQSHAFLIEEYTKAFIDNIITTYGFHGFVIKAKNIQVGNIKSYGSVGEGVFIKSDDDNRQSVNNQISNIIVDRVPTGHPYRITTRDSSQNAVFIAGIISFANKNQISSINAKGYTYGVQIQANDTTDISNLHINSIIADSCKNGVIYYGRNINQVTIDAVNVINAKDNVIQAYLTGATTASNAISIGNLTVTGSTDRANLINIAGRGGIQIDYVESANAALQDVFTIGANGYLKISDYNIGTNYINLYGTGSLAVTGLRADITTINSTSLPLKYDKTGGNINAGTGLQTNVNINSNVTAQLQLNSTYPSTGKSWYATSYLDGNLYIAQPGIGNVITGNGTTGHVDFMNTVTGLDPVNAQDFVTKGYQSTQLALKANLATTPQIVAHGDLTAQTATGTICTYTVGATNESLTLQMSHNVTTTLVGATNYQVTFTDINNVAVTYKASIAMGTVVGYMGVAAGTGSNNNVFVNPLIRAKAGTTVTLMTTGTLTSGVMDISGSITKLY